MYDGAEPAAYIKPQDEVCAQGFGWKKGAFAPVSSINDAVALDLILVSQLYTCTPEFYTDESRYTVAELGEPSSVLSY